MITVGDRYAAARATEALRDAFGAAGSSVKLAVLSACYTEAAAHALLGQVDCVVVMAGSIHDDAARSFAIGFYGGLAERESIEDAYRGGCAAIGLDGFPDHDRPQLKARRTIDPAAVILAELTPAAATQETGRSRRTGSRRSCPGTSPASATSPPARG